MKNPYAIVEEFEEVIADYAGAKFGVATNSCTSALMISAALRKRQQYAHHAYLPKFTYVGVPQAFMAAGFVVHFQDMDWHGEYEIPPLNIVDSARRFRRDMYHGGLHCLSFHWGKHLKIGQGGMVLTDSGEEAIILRKLRYDGRTPGRNPKVDRHIAPAWHVPMLPSQAAHGLMLMQYMADDNPDLPWDDYADCSQIEAFK